jgi:hypothetical protein
MKRRRLRLTILLAASFAGILAAHAVDYWLVISNAAHRHELLLGTGHGYWPHVAAIGVLAAVIAALCSFGSGLAKGRGNTPGGWILAMLQAGGFGALEAAERIGAGNTGRAFGMLLVVGIALQVAIAFLVSAVMRSLEIAASAIVRAKVPTRVAAPMRGRGARAASLRAAFSPARPVRGPPALCC